MGMLRVGILTGLCLFCASAVWAGPTVRVPQTGLALCYDENDDIIDCEGTGQDGEIQKGFDLPSPRFTDTGDGTIKDNLTGLIWLRNAWCVGDLTWRNALDFIKNLNQGFIINPLDCGDTSGRRGSHQTDWRLPNLRELMSLMDFAFSSPAVSNAARTGSATLNDPFTNLQQTVYWTSTTSDANKNTAWLIDVTDGGSFVDFKSEWHPVMAVRGGR